MIPEAIIAQRFSTILKVKTLIFVIWNIKESSNCFKKNTKKFKIYLLNSYVY